MELPPISHIRRDPKAGVVYDVRAYRDLSEEEVLQQIRGYLAHAQRHKRPKRGEKITILTILGSAPGL